MSSIASRIRRHLADQESHHRQITIGFLWVSFFVLLGKLAGAAKEMTIAWRYGVSETVDAYVFIFNLVNWPVSVWFSVLTVVLVPLVARLKHDDHQELSRFRGELLGLTLLIGLALGCLVYTALLAVLHAGMIGLEGKALQEAVGMVRWLAVLVPIGVVISLFSAWMLACGNHLNTLLEAIPALIILIALLLPISSQPEPLVWGTVAGLTLQMVGLAWLLRRAGELQAPRIGLHSLAWKGIWHSVGILSLGQLMATFTGIVDQFFAAELGPGAISTLNYANRILALVLSMGALAISRATLPIFSEAQASPNKHVNALALHWTKWMFLAGMAVSVVGMITAPFIVEMLFERGAFTQENTHVVATLLRYCLIQVPFYFSGLVLVSALASAKRYSIIALSGSLNLLFKVVIAYLLVEPFHLTGLVISTAAMYALTTGLLYALARTAFLSKAD